MTADPFTEYDGAYVLGALSDEDRAAFERHLIGCGRCRASVDSLRPLPTLLGQVADIESVERTPATTPTDLLPRLLTSVARQRRRRRWYTAAVAAAAACVLAVVVLLARSGGGSSGSPVAMREVVNSPMHATALVQAAPWGTRIELACSYDSGLTYPSNIAYTLHAVDDAGATHDLGSWSLVVGGVTKFDAGVALPPNQLDRLEVSTTTGTEILELQL